MRKAIIITILYVLILHVFLPAIFYWYKGTIITLYSPLLDIDSFIKAGVIITLSLILSITALLFFKKDVEIKPNIKGAPVTALFYGAVIFQLATFYMVGGYAAIIAGESNGALSKYFSLFLNPYILLLVVLFAQEKKAKIIKAILFYVIAVTLSGSRSGILTVFFIFFVGLAFETFGFYRKKVTRLLKYSLIISPLLYVFATQLRNSDSSSDYSILQYAIAGRISALETAMLPIYYYDNGLDLSLFYEKYDFIHQAKLVLDGFIPGQIFEFDVMPNNYFRAIFTGYDVSYVQENYLSINITLPIYLYLKYDLFCIILTVLYVLGFYFLVRFLRKSPLIVIVLLSGFYNVIYFFDWVMVFNQLYSGLLTILLVKTYIYSRGIFSKIIRLENG